jgi:hypothetical protein
VQASVISAAHGMPHTSAGALPRANGSGAIAGCGEAAGESFIPTIAVTTESPAIELIEDMCPAAEAGPAHSIAHANPSASTKVAPSTRRQRRTLSTGLITSEQ